jgi:SGNH hydrolase-like domain, acetyltransferase AlgX
MQHRPMRIRTALAAAWRMPVYRRAAIAMAILCLLPLIDGVAFALMGRSPWLGTAAGPKLAGFVQKQPPPKFDWWDRSFQTTVTALVDERLPLRNWMVRISNQLDFWLLGASRQSNVVIGRDGVLFEKVYIEEAFGYRPAVPDEQLRRIGADLKRLSERLARRRITTVVLGTPGKVSFMRDAVPSAFTDFHAGAPRNYDRLARVFAEMGVPFVDGRAEMRNAAADLRAPLFARGGTHWTRFGAFKAIERPVARMLAEAAPAPGRLVLDDVSMSAGTGDTDTDLLSVLNLLIRDRSYRIVNVKLHLEGPPLPKAVALVGSSFVHQIRALLEQAGIAPRVLVFQYMTSYFDCPACGPAEVPAAWPQTNANETSALIVEINEAAFFASADYLEVLSNALLPLLDEPQAPPRDRPGG